MRVVCEDGRLLRPLGRVEWGRVYGLMRERGFPGVPATAHAAYECFEKTRLLGLVGKDVDAAFVFGPPEDGVAFFDVVCRSDKEGRWATPRVLKALFAYAFEDMGLRAVWVQPLKGKPLRAALRAGFVPATPLDAVEPVLVMTPNLVPARLRTS